MNFLILFTFVIAVITEIESTLFSERKSLQNPQITIQNGIVEGIQSRTIDAGKTYYGFHGIPYAEPPTGNLRFLPPVPANKWEGVYNASYERDICVQSTDPVIGSEDCLYVNVYTPKLPSSKRWTPYSVMVWIYGGSFIEGDGNYTRYGPDYFLNEDVVVVTFNYRLGPFGFLSTEDLIAPGNIGLKDQILALKWIQNNIAAFGGNPKSVTLFGESAGGASIAYLIQSPLTSGLYHRAIMQSGTSLIASAISRKARSYAFTTGEVLGIHTNDSETLIRNLRDIPYQQLQEASANASTLVC